MNAQLISDPTVFRLSVIEQTHLIPDCDISGYMHVYTFIESAQL